MRDEYDMTDLADIVQRGRGAMWRLPHHALPWQLYPWHEHPETYPVAIAHLEGVLAGWPKEDERERIVFVIDEYTAIHAALLAGPRTPPLDELLDRYLKGELGDRTIRYVMGWASHWDLIEALQERNLPIFHGALAEDE